MEIHSSSPRDLTSSLPPTKKNSNKGIFSFSFFLQIFRSVFHVIFVHFCSILVGLSYFKIGFSFTPHWFYINFKFKVSQNVPCHCKFQVGEIRGRQPDSSDQRSSIFFDLQNLSPQLGHPGVPGDDVRSSLRPTP